MNDERIAAEPHSEMRRTVVKGGLGLATLAALPGGIASSAHAQSAFDWKRFKGEKLEVSMVKSPRADLLQKYQKEFEDLTGIAAVIERQRRRVQLQRLDRRHRRPGRAGLRLLHLLHPVRGTHRAHEDEPSGERADRFGDGRCRGVGRLPAGSRASFPGRGRGLLRRAALGTRECRRTRGRSDPVRQPDTATIEQDESPKPHQRNQKCPARGMFPKAFHV